ncbi:MAG: hypothetical protein WC470_03700 [Candidatus Paceibacterota bacterium]
MDLNNFFQSKTFSVVLMIIGAMIALLLVFKLGMDIGFRKANFSYQWGENYYRNFAGPAESFPKNMIKPDDFMNAHGVLGEIIKIDSPNLVIKDRNTLEKVVLVKDDTVIRNLKQNLKLSDLKINESIVVIGESNESGQIEAGLIRILPPPPPEKTLERFPKDRIKK